ncbi:MAG: diacylglycerol kinase, partial [Bacteroidales bacterium]|nr:diacylglycerol kinase [Bacteroidales bacterium]
MNNEKFSVRKRIKSFSYAFAGLRVLFREEHNARIHAVAAVLAVAMGFLFRISP